MLSISKKSFADQPLLSTLIAVIFIFSIGNYVVNGLWGGLRYKGMDFVGYYANGKMLVQSVDIHDPEKWKQGVIDLNLTRDGKPLERATRSDYPPFWYLLMSVFSGIPWQQAFNLWIALNQIFLIVLIGLLFNYFDVKIGSLESFFLIFLMLNYYPLFYTLMEGQVNIFLLLLIVLALWLFKKERDWAAGLILGLATGIKIVPAFILFYFLWKGHWKVVIFGALGFISTLLITAWGAGAEIVVSYYTGQLFKYGASPNPDIFNQSINGFWSRLLMRSQAAGGWINQPGSVNTVIRVSALIVFLISLFCTRGKFERCGLRWNLGLGIFLLTMMLASAWTMEHHFINLYIPLIIIFLAYFRGQEVAFGAVLAFVLCYGLAAFNLPYTSGKFNSGILILVKSLKFYILLAMWILMCLESRRLRLRSSL